MIEVEISEIVSEMRGENIDVTSVAEASIFNRDQNVSFGGTGDASFDSLMNEVDQFITETNHLTDQARAEIAARKSPMESSGYVYNTGDVGLDNLLNKTQQELSEYNNFVNQVRMELGPGKYLSIDDAINQAGSNGLLGYIQQRLEWMENATPEQLKQYSHQMNWRHEIEIARAHERNLLQDRGDLLDQFVKHQTKDQFNAEKAGYRQINPWDSYRGYTGDPNLFEKDGVIYRLMPNSSGNMVRL